MRERCWQTVFSILLKQFTLCWRNCKGGTILGDSILCST